MKYIVINVEDFQNNSLIYMSTLSVEIDILLIIGCMCFVTLLELFSDGKIFTSKFFFISGSILQLEQSESPKLHTSATEIR